MKIVLFADGLVGFGIANYLLENYKDDLVSIICIQENDIYDFIASDTVNYDNLNQSYLEKILDDLSEIIGQSKLDEIIYKNPLNIIDHKNSNNYQI